MRSAILCGIVYSSGRTVSSVLKVVFILANFSIGSLLCFKYQPKLFSSPFIHPSQLISPLPPLRLGTYNRATSLFGWSVLYIVINFLVFLSIHSNSSLVHFSNPAPYLKREIAHTLIAFTILFPFNFNFTINLVLLRYSYLNLSFISFSLMLSSSNIPRYL